MFNYFPPHTGSVQQFTAPKTGTYKLEVWGAQGGYHIENGALISTYYMGGYTIGYYNLSLNKNIYVSVGGMGEGAVLSSTSKGGWNGGGDGEWDHSDDEAEGGGGGATSMQTTLIGDGQLKNYEKVKDTEVLIVAGGAAAWHILNTDTKYQWGFGGGSEGGCGAVYVFGTGGAITRMKFLQIATQISGYAFGQGQSGKYNSTYANCEIPGAGGGWYGGYTNVPDANAEFSSAGGGSGHIGTMLSNGSMKSGMHSGNGYAVISWIP